MEIIIILFVFLFGLIIGSFLNVVIFRYNTGLGIGGRSRCLSCGRRLGFLDLFPVASFVFFGGKCRTCKAKISWQYPLVELTCGLFFVLAYLKFGLSIELYFVLVSFFLLLAIAVYDLKHKIIPDGLVFAFIFVSILKMLERNYLGGIGFDFNFLDLFSGLILATPFALIFFLSGGKWMGFGDAKLALGIGWFLGLYSGLNATIISFWIGAVVSLGLLLIQKIFPKGFPLKFGGDKLTIKSEIPFAPFLILGMLLQIFYQFDFFHVFFI